MGIIVEIINFLHKGTGHSFDESLRLVWMTLAVEIFEPQTHLQLYNFQ